jgi:hypothetical protein
LYGTAQTLGAVFWFEQEDKAEQASASLGNAADQPRIHQASEAKELAQEPPEGVNGVTKHGRGRG